MEMGFDEDKCRVCLERAGGDVAMATDHLFNM